MNDGLRRKHGVGFETAKLVFADPFARSEQGRIEGHEARWTTIGQVGGQALLIVPLSDEQQAELAALAALPDSGIDTSDIPSLPESFWDSAVRGRFYKPTKTSTTVRLDSDVLAWLRSQGQGYQTRLNGILRRAMLEQLKPR